MRTGPGSRPWTLWGSGHGDRYDYLVFKGDRFRSFFAPLPNAETVELAMTDKRLESLDPEEGFRRGLIYVARRSDFPLRGGESALNQRDLRGQVLIAPKLGADERWLGLGPFQRANLDACPRRSPLRLAMYISPYLLAYYYQGKLDTQSIFEFPIDGTWSLLTYHLPWVVAIAALAVLAVFLLAAFLGKFQGEFPGSAIVVLFLLRREVGTGPPRHRPYAGRGPGLHPEQRRQE